VAKGAARLPQGAVVKKLDLSNIAEIRDAIAEACKDKKIRTGAFGVESHFGPMYPVPAGCCPLGALACGIEDNDGPASALTKKGFSSLWINSFWKGFDHNPDISWEQRSSWAYMLGRHFRQVYDRGELGVWE
jgi:hypothetical protein